jgi:hypothetical protein
MPIDAIDLDHVAVAAERWADLWPRYGGELGGTWISGGQGSGFAACQVRLGGDLNLEMLEPHGVEHNDFLRRFLDRNGPGSHHVTFKVDDIVGALETAEAAGYRPVAVNLDEPEWKEAFLHPKDAPGIVVQLAESHGTWTSEPPPTFPIPRHGATAVLLRVVHAVADLDEGMALFRGLLHGDDVDRGELDGGTWVDLAWPGGGRIRLLEPRPGTDAHAWLEGRAGRLHHLAFACPWLDAPTTVAPDDNHGTPLLLLPEGVS